MNLLEDAPLYNDVMLPSTSEHLALPLTDLTPSESPRSTPSPPAEQEVPCGRAGGHTQASSPPVVSHLTLCCWDLMPLITLTKC